MHEREHIHGQVSGLEERTVPQRPEEPYVKPTLRSLGKWDLFTRSPSETEDKGFVELGF